MFDFIITGGTVVDGTGAPGYRADVGITGEKITAIGDLSQAAAKRIINANGLTVSPGFIDTHTHSDAALLIDPQHPEGLRQGITTELLGQDGLSYAPLSPENYRAYSRYLSGILGTPPPDLDMSSVAAFRSHYHKKCAINVAYPISHGAVRLETCGFADIPMTGERMEKAKRLIREGMEQGAIGLATGMSYHPQAWSDTAELIELCKVIAEYGGVYQTHLRDVNTDRAFGGGGIPEALEIGRRSGVKVHFSHHRTSAANAGKVKERLELIVKAQAEGVDCTMELYPYPTGSTFPLSFLPSYAHEGGPDGIRKRLANPVERKKLADYLTNQTHRYVPEAVLSYLPNKNTALEGMSMPKVVEMRGGISSGEALLQILEEEDFEVGYWGTPPDDIKVWRQLSRDFVEFLSRPDYMVGSDSIHFGSTPHPRGWGTFPRFLGRLRRQFNTISLEQMVQRVTDNPARRFGLKSRGRIEKGYFADIVVFDADRMIDTATYDDAKQYPVGIPFVLVNGQVAVDNERCTGVYAGQAVP
ncbi:MAG: D-aminoacylase [SAR202 cluster bacterium]|nr:D-aminoacylase [SAR202 cluster bacterium]